MLGMAFFQVYLRMYIHTFKIASLISLHLDLLLPPNSITGNQAKQRTSEEMETWKDPFL